ncbi:hypothetical protein TrRE_jg13167, partial [Triparma retinervis]
MPQKDNSHNHLEYNVSSNRKFQVQRKIKVAEATYDKNKKKVDVMVSTESEILRLRKRIWHNKTRLAELEKCPSTMEDVRIAQCKARILEQQAELAKLTGPKVGGRFQYVGEVGKVVQKSFTQKNEAMKLQINDVVSKMNALEDANEANEERIKEVLENAEDQLKSITANQAEIDSLFGRVSLLEDRVMKIEEEFTQRLHEIDAFKGEVVAEVEAVALKAEAVALKAEAADRKAEATDRKAEANSAAL